MIVNCYVKYKDYYVGQFMINKPDNCSKESENHNEEKEE